MIFDFLYLVLAFQWLRLDVTSAQINQQFCHSSFQASVAESHLRKLKIFHAPLGPSSVSSAASFSSLYPSCPGCPHPSSSASAPHLHPHPAPALPGFSVSKGLGLGQRDLHESVPFSCLPEELVSSGSVPDPSCQVFTPRWWGCVVLVCFQVLWWCLYLHKD